MGRERREWCTPDRILRKVGALEDVLRVGRRGPDYVGRVDILQVKIRARPPLRLFGVAKICPFRCLQNCAHFIVVVVVVRRLCGYQTDADLCHNEWCVGARKRQVAP